MTTDQAALGEFFSETEEILGRLAANFNLIEKGSVPPPVLDELYRDTHTMKGTSQLFGLKELGMLAHAMESSLAPVRKLGVPPGSALLDALFLCVDRIEAFVRQAKSGDGSAELRGTELLAVLPALIEAACSQFGQPHDIFPDVLIDEDISSADSIAVESPEPPLSGAPLQTEHVPAPSLTSPAAPAAPAIPPAPTAPADPVESPPQSAGVESADTTIRVQVGVLDRLMNLVGEMVLVRNQVLQYTDSNEDLELLNLSQRLDLVTSDLQEQVMRTRMQPIGTVLGKFQRLIRDLAKDLGKQIDLTVQGKDTELDKTLLEAIKDPLTHIVRNSCDHGIERPEERSKGGKPETGHLLISAYHEGGQVIIEISDDGKGLNRQKILSKAIEKGLIPQERASSLSDRDTIGLIFLPGFSTAEAVSTVSGRGVGMDVVRTNIEKIGGSVDLESVEGKGTTIRLRIPLTLAIVPAMLIRSQREVYAIPQVKLVELVRVDASSDRDQGGIKILQGKPVYELRGKILPLVDLSTVLGRKTDKNLTPSSMGSMNIVVLNAEGETFGLIVEEVLDTADIVVKPLSKFLKSLGLYSAATILGTGSVALILDPAGIAKAVHLSAKSRKQEGVFADASVQRRANADAQEYLLFRTGGPGKFAIPLCVVNRLEEIPRDQIEYSGEQAIVRYRKAILPLIDLDQVLEFKKGALKDCGTLPLIVVSRSGKLVGIIVDQILDIATVDAPVDDTVKDRFGILGNLILGQEVVTVLDTLGVVERQAARLSGAPSGSTASEKPSVAMTSTAKRRVLYAEDVAFFRKQVTKLLQGAGFEVETVHDGKAAAALLKDSLANKYDLILSDIEMPKMNGYELAQEIRKDSRLASVPLIALTTRFSAQDVAKGREAGFDLYLEKLNPEALLDAVHKAIKQEKAA